MEEERNKMKFALIQCGFSNENRLYAKKMIKHFLFSSSELQNKNTYKKKLFIYFVNICFAFPSWDIQVPKLPQAYIEYSNNKTIN